MTKGPYSFIYAMVILFALGLAFFTITRNSLIRLDEGVNAAWSEVDNQLQRRSDLIPRLVNTVKGYAAHEEELFTEIANARARLAGGASVEEKAAGYNETRNVLSRLLAVAESYPELKASQNFTALQDELAGTENRLAVARKRYNDSVGNFNVKIRTFPGSLFADNLKFSPKAYFEIDENARAAPQVQF
ncbi:MAG: LemA family protein [Treponema sp.]|jgi:LemA protein|nr:LemA family protein [Treponema sp.]